MSMLKYTINNVCKLKDFGEFILEFPIDICVIVLTVLTTAIVKHDGQISIDLQPTTPFSMLLLFASLGVVVISCFFRRKALIHSYSSHKNRRFRAGCYGVGVYVCVFVWTYYMHKTFILGL